MSQEIMVLGKKVVIEGDPEAYLMRLCKTHVHERITVFLPHFKMKPKKITILKSHNKWGSCNASRELTFNFMLITQPSEFVDYVIVHELCHMVHLNHDRSFWRLVGSIFPDYRKYQIKE